MLKRSMIPGAAAILLMSAFCYANDNISEYTERESFLGALNLFGFDDVDVLDFDGIAAGDPVLPGSVLGDVVINVPSAVVADDVATTSGDNYLGLDDPGALNRFASGDGIEFGFTEPKHAVGFDIVASSPSASVRLNVATGAQSGGPVAVLDDGGFVYFVGLISTEFKPDFASVDFLSVEPGGDPVFYAIDNLTVATIAPQVPVPEPPFGSLLVVALLGRWGQVLYFNWTASRKNRFRMARSS